MKRAAALLAVAVLVCTACTSATGVGGQPAAVESRHLVYTRGAGVDQAVWIGDVEGRRMRRLIRGSYGLVSPDGATVAVSRRAGIFLVGSDGRGGRLVARGRPAAWHPDSRRLLAVQANALVNIDLEDGGVGVVERREVVSWSISPDGQKVVYDVYGKAAPGECRFEIYSARLDGTAKRRLTSGGRSSNPVWGGDGIAYAYRPPGTGCFEPRIWRMDEDGRNRVPLMERLPRRLATSGFYGVRPYAWIQGRRALLATVPTEWGAVLALVDTRDGTVRMPDLDPRPRSRTPMYVDDASSDGRHVVGAACGAEGPCAIRIYSVIDRRSRTIATGSVRYPDWNR